MVLGPISHSNGKVVFVLVRSMNRQTLFNVKGPFLVSAVTSAAGRAFTFGGNSSIYWAQLSTVLINWRFNNFIWLCMTRKSFLQTLNCGRCEELLARLRVYSGRHVFDDVELAVHLQCVGHSLFDWLSFKTFVRTVPRA